MLTLALALDTQSVTEPLGTSGPDLTRYLTVCVLLILATVGLGWAFKKLVAGSLKSRAATRSLSIMDVLPLGGKHKLAVVRCYDRTFVLGLGEREVALISELDAAVAPKREHAPSKADVHGFKAILDELRKRPEPATAKSQGSSALDGELFA